MQAITIDGTVVEFDEFQVGQRGITLQKRSQGKQKQSSQGKQSEQAKQAMKQAEEPAQKITREELQETFAEGSGSSQRGKQGGGSNSGGGTSSQHRIVGFVPYHSLLYVVPDETVHDVSQLNALA